MNEIAVSASEISWPTGSTLKLNIATRDVALEQHKERWTDTLDISMVRMVRMVQGDDNPRITGQSLRLTLKPVTYAKLLQDGIPFDQAIDRKQTTGAVRIIVVYENSGRMGSVTVPAAVVDGGPGVSPVDRCNQLHSRCGKQEEAVPSMTQHFGESRKNFIPILRVRLPLFRGLAPLAEQ